MSEGRTARIRALNDRVRQDLVEGRRVITAGVAELGALFVYRCVTAIQAFEAFNEDNDPHGEHDFGAVDVCGITIFWKIDYFNLTLTMGAADPSDPETCTRVLTIMCADEY